MYVVVYRTVPDFVKEARYKVMNRDTIEELWYAFYLQNIPILGFHLALAEGEKHNVKRSCIAAIDARSWV